MAFNVDEFVKKQTQVKPGGFDVEKFVETQTQKVNSGGFNVNQFLQSQGIKPKVDLASNSGLVEQAQLAGKGQRAQEIVDTKGEAPDKIFSGGWISDTFDVLNAAQYGVVGLIKGKSFAEGVKTRESFSKKDALGEYGLPGVIAGVALDIAVDPFTYIAPWTILKKIPGASKVASSVGDVAKASAVGQKMGKMFVYRFGQDPVYAKMADRFMRNTGVEVQNMVDIARPLSKLSAADQTVVMAARKAGKLQELAPELLERSRPAFEELDKLGKEAVQLGLLDAKTYDANVGTYIARLYRKYEDPNLVDKATDVFNSKTMRIVRDRFMKRKDIADDVRDAMGEIMEAGYPTAKSLIQLKAANEHAKFFKEVAGKFSTDIAGDGLSQLPKTARLGELAGRYVPTPIFDDIQEIAKQRSATERVVGKIVGGFKFGKVVLNPATHSRNIMSNFILNDFEGLSPARLDIYARAGKELAKKGDYYQEARKVGLGLDTYAANEIKDMLIGPDTATWSRPLKKAMEKISNAYQKEEEFAKMAMYIFQREKGLTPELAMHAAERATFNYAQVTPFIRKVRENAFGLPFVTFTYKSTPQAIKTIATKPQKIAKYGKLKNAVENQSDQDELSRERASEPSWVKDGFYAKLPIKDKHGRSAYLDLTYILPFGDLVSGQFFGRQTSRETGLPESVPAALMERSPAANLLKELSRNQDFYGNKIWKDSDSTEKQMGDLMRHITKTYLPPTLADQIPGGYRRDGSRRPGTIQKMINDQQPGIEGGGGGQRTLMQELIKQVGIKIQPVDIELQESMSENDLRKALETLLLEGGDVSEFNRLYVPKE